MGDWLLRIWVAHIRPKILLLYILSHARGVVSPLLWHDGADGHTLNFGKHIVSPHLAPNIWNHQVFLKHIFLRKNTEMCLEDAVWRFS